MKRFAFRAVSLVLLIALCLTVFAGCSSPRTEVVLIANGTEIQKDDFMAHLFFVKYDMFYEDLSEGSASMSDIITMNPEMLATVLIEGTNGEDDTTLSDYLHFSASQSALSAVLCRQLALENKLKITSSEEATIDESMSSLVSGFGGAKAYNTFLDESGTTEDALRRYMEDMYYMQKLQLLFSDGNKYALTTEEREQAQEGYKAAYATVQHMLFFTMNTSTGAKLAEGDIELQYANAQAALARLKNGESFDGVAADADITQTLTFTTGQMLAAFDEAAFALQVGEYSDIVETDYGFHIILRKPLTNDEYSTYYTAVLSQKFSEFLNEYSEAAEIEIPDAYYSIVIQ